ncbi:MAG: hypothetical protein IAE93_14505 [Ignavibacteria bacterium]|mgnify:CR=1 FL=1|nr:hypothetical protein [Ignavibacteria bacterium]
MKTRVLITVKTYPTISTKYEELVCTAGFREDGSWIRIFPIPFRKLDYNKQYKKYDWIELDLTRNLSDFRPETYRPVSDTTVIDIIGHIGYENNWMGRKEIVLKNVYYDLSKLIKDAKNKNKITSLAVFKPTKVLAFTYEKTSSEWSESKKKILNQLNLFEPKGSTFQIVRKLPYKFSYTFEDINGTKSKLMIEDWETAQLYWNCLTRANGDEEKACKDVYKKYFDDFSIKKDLYFYLGTTKVHHFVAPNPFIIIGTFHPKKDLQVNLFK